MDGIYKLTMEEEWTRSHYLCNECGLEQWDDFSYPDACRVCNPCRAKIGIFTKEHYEELWLEREQNGKM